MEVLVCIENTVLARSMEDAVTLIEPFQVSGVFFDGGSLLRELRRIEVDVVVLGAGMVADTGRELLRVIGEEFPETKVLQVGGWRATYSVEGDADLSEHFVPIDATVEELGQALRLTCFGVREFAAPKPARRTFAPLLVEIGAILLILGFSVFLARDLFIGEFLLTGYADWVFHAYRVKSLLDYGFLTWTNDWGGGFPLWQNYQFVPHVATLVLKWATDWSITRSMVFVTGVLFVFFRLAVYGGLRFAGFPVSAALVGSILTLAMVGYYGPLGDFSLLWGVTLFPVAYFLLVAPGRSVRRIYLASLLLGLGIYVHPMLAVLGTVALACYIVVSRDLSLIEALTAFAIVLLSASFYWFPVLFADKPAYVSEWESSAALQRALFPTSWLGLSPSLVDVGVALGTLALVARGFRLSETNPRLFKTTVATLCIVFPIVIAAYLGLTPSLINQLEPARWTAFVGILLAILGAFVVRSVRGRWSTPFILTVAVAAIAADSLIIAQTRLPPVSDQQYPSGVVQCLAEGGLVSYSDRIIAPGHLIPEISFYYFAQVRTAGNYFGKGALDLLNPALMWLLRSGDEGSLLRTADPTLTLAYAKTVGGTLFVIAEGEPIARELLPGGNLEGELPLRHRSNGYALFEVPGRRLQAFITSPARARELIFPDVKYDTEAQRKERDALVLRFAETIEAPETIAVEVWYPAQTEIGVAAYDVPRDSYLIVLAPYDGAWEAKVNGQPRRVERAGPHYVGLDLSGLEGEIEVELAHQMHWTWKAGAALVLVAFFVFAALMLREGGWSLASFRLWTREFVRRR